MSRTSMDANNEEEDQDEDDEDDEDDDPTYNARSGKGLIKSNKAGSNDRAIIRSGSAVTKPGWLMRKGLTISQGGVSLLGVGCKKRKHYPPSWGQLVDKTKMKKRVLYVYDGQRRSWKDGMMIDNQSEVQIKLADGKSYITEMDVETLKREEGDSDSNNNNDDTSESSSSIVPDDPAITPPDATQVSCSTSGVQNSSRLIAKPAPPTQKIRAFPRLGFKTTNDDGSDAKQITPEDEHSPGSRSSITATDVDPSPTHSDLSGSGWTEDRQDAETLRLVAISSKILVSAYLKLARIYRSNECENGAAMDDSPPYKAPSKQTQQTQNSSKGRKRKLNRSDSGSDDFDDNDNPKRQRIRSMQFYPSKFGHFALGLSLQQVRQHSARTRFP